jgi:lipopolysaccharide export system protein LptA
MFRRIKRVTLTLAVVMTAYFTYALGAVPLIEPSAPTTRGKSASELRIENARQRPTETHAELAQWFQPGDWELTSSKVIETARGMLLLEHYSNQGDGNVELKPCTVIFFPTEPDTEEGRRQAIILKAPQGAVLEFDRPLDLRRGDVGRLIGGRVDGPFTIYSDQKSPGPQDDLRIEGHDAVMADQQIVSRHPIEFRLGANEGRGEHLKIDLLPGDEKVVNGPNVGGVRSLELARNVEFHLEFGDRELLPLDSALTSVADPAKKKAVPGASGKTSPPLHVSCQGPFRFELDPYVATFKDQVDVLRMNPEGPSDSLKCELLAIQFAAAEAGSSESNHNLQAVPKLEPTRLEAYGNPVIVHSPGEQVEARGQALVYDLKRNQASLTGKPDVMLKQRGNEIRAPELHFQASADRRWGTFSALGPGWFEGAAPDDPARRIRSRWRRKMTFAPQDNDYLLTVSGQAMVEMPTSGRLNSEEIFLWLSDPGPEDNPATRGNRPSPRGPTRLVPNRMLAKGDVTFDSPQLTGGVDELQVWFNHLPSVQGISGSAQRTGLATPIEPAFARGSGSTMFVSYPNAPARPAIRQGDAMPRGPIHRIAARPGNGPPRPGEGLISPGQRYQVNGRLLRAELAVRGTETQLSTVNISGGVRFAELAGPGGDPQPLKILGDELHVDHTNPAAARITLSGEGAHVEARGMQLEGSPLTLDRGSNHVTIMGPGRMVLPPGQGNAAPQVNLLGAGPATNKTPLEVRWRGTMDFDGQLARFEREVEAILGPQMLRTGLMEVSLSQRVDFAEVTQQVSPEVELVRCYDGVLMESRTHQAQGLMSVEYVRLTDLMLNQRTGEVQGTGPGQMQRVALGGANAWDGLTAATGGAGNPANPPLGGSPTAAEPEPAKWNFLGVDFDNQMTGNLHRKQLVLHGRVRTMYGPVEGWQGRLTQQDFDRPEESGQQGVYVKCDTLTVSQGPQVTQGRAASMELQTSGNTEVEGMNFNGQHFLAQSQRLSYDQAKDLLVLEGDGRSPATLWRWERLGDTPAKAAARKIRYWRSQGKADVDDAQMLDLQLLSGQQGTAREAQNVRQTPPR